MEKLTYLDWVMHRDPDVFEIIFKDRCNDAINEYVEVMFAILNQIREEHKLDVPLYIMIDTTQSGLYSLRYALTVISKNLIPYATDIPSIYFAYITDDQVDRNLIEQFRFMQNTRQKDSRKVFGSHEREEAIAWLVSHRDA